MRQTLAQALDDCLIRMRRDGESIERCLSAYPRHAAQLEPLLLLAQRMTAEAAPSARPDAQERIARRLEGLLTNDRQPFWKRIFPPAAYRLALSSAVATVVLAVIAIAGAGIAAQPAVPGDTLYGVRLATERAEGVIRRDSPLAEHQRLSGRRLAELRVLVRRGDADNAARAAGRYESEHQALLRAAATAPPAQAEAAQRRAAAQILELAALRDGAGATSAPVSELLARLGSTTPPAIAASQSGEIATSEAARPAPPAARAAPIPVANAPPSRLAGLFAQLLATTTEAERAGAVNPAEAAELRVLLASASTLNIGGEHAVVATALGRLGAALASCAGRGCAGQAALTPLIESVHAAALTLGLPPPPALMVQSSPPIAAPRVAATPAGRPVVPAATAAPRPAPAVPLPPVPTGAASGVAPPPAAAGVAPAPALAAPPAAAPVPASGPAEAATPSRPAPSAAATATAAPAPAAAATAPARATPPGAASPTVTGAPSPAAGAPVTPTPAATVPPSPQPTNSR